MNAPGSAGPGMVGRLVSVIVGTIVLVIGLMFSVVVLAVGVAAGAGVWAWFWWKTRKLRQRMREPAPDGAAASPGGHVIEGEAVIVEEEVTRVTSSRLPESPDRRSPG